MVSFVANFVDLHYTIASNTIGYSLFFNLIIIYFLKQLKYCIHTIIAMYSLTVLNIFNMLDAFNIIEYYTYSLYFDGLVFFLMFLSMLIYSVKK